MHKSTHCHPVFTLALLVFLLAGLFQGTALCADSQKNVEELYFKALDLEEKAGSKADYEKAAMAYLTMARQGKNSRDRELIASALYAAGQIYEKRLGDTERAREVYQKLTGDYPGTSWSSNGQSAMDRIISDQQTASKMGESVSDTGFKTPPQSGTYKKGYKLYDPALLSQNLLIPADPVQIAEEKAELEELMKIPHFPPIQAREILTGDNIIASMLEKMGNLPRGNQPEDLSLSLELIREEDRSSCSISVMSVKGNTRLAFENFEIYLADSETLVRIPSLGIHCSANGDSGGAEIIHRIIARLGALPYLRDHTRDYAGRYVKTEDGYHIVDLFSKKDKEPVFVSLWIKEDFSALANISIQDFDSKRTIITGSVNSFRVSTGFDPSLMGIPMDSRRAASIPPDFTMPPALEM